MKVIMLQFIKHTTANFGEQRAAKKMDIEVRAMGDGFTWRSKDLDNSADLARAHWEDCKEVIAKGEHDVVILDEFTPCTTAGCRWMMRWKPCATGPR